MKHVILFALICFTLRAQAQQNISLLSKIDYQALHDTYLNDIWGFIDGQGNEYALVGARKGTSIVSLADPSNPQEILWVPGSESVWRDLQSWGNYAFVTTEAKDGLLILDLSSLPDVSGVTANYYTGPANNPWQSAHDIFVDSSGYAYIFGANRGNKGVIILDVHTDPMNPTEVGVFDNWYCHDGYALGDTLYLAHIYDGLLSVVDITDRSNPVLKGTQLSPNAFTHNVWVTPDGRYGFTTDEVSGAYLASYDLSDPAAITELDRVRTAEGKGVMPHNTFWINGYLVTSYYSEGVTIHDASRPGNMIQTGSYDTYPLQTIGSDGCWGVYPFLPSGIILASDIETGLFVLQPDYHRACYLEGTITSAQNGQPINNVLVTLSGSDQPEHSDISGAYATGDAAAGSVDVTFFVVGYYPKTVTATLVEGQVTVLDVQLDPIPTFPVKVVVKHKTDNTPLINTHVRLQGSLTNDELLTNGLGEATFNLYYPEVYHVSAGIWGFQTACFDQNLDVGAGTITIALDPGYYDDFDFDFGWTTQNNGATKGLWELGEPFGSSTNSAPDNDCLFDCGDQAWVTGNYPSLDPDKDDVKEGEVILTSPLFDLSSINDPWLHFNTWFYCYHGELPFDDSLKVYLSDGSQQVLIHELHSDLNTFHFWNESNIRVKDYLTPTANMRLIIKTSDLTGQANITEGGFDYFWINESPLGSVPQMTVQQLTLQPNPASGEVQLLGSTALGTVTLCEVNGQIISRWEHTGTQLVMDVSSLAAGMYLVQSGSQTLRLMIH